jgi:GGDEF domain-containing protein
VTRLERSVAERNALPGREYSLGVSAGVAHYAPAASKSLDELLAEADKLMYQEKERRKQTR